MKIHISSTTKDILDSFPEFIVQLRGRIDIKVRGPMGFSLINSQSLQFDSRMYIGRKKKNVL